MRKASLKRILPNKLESALTMASRIRMPALPMLAIIMSLLVAQTSRRKKRPRKNRAIYSKTDWNYVADSVIHPLIRHSRVFILLDEAAHFLIENNPEQSILKFARYRAPVLLEEFLKFMINSNKAKKKEPSDPKVLFSALSLL